jgi:hypothetical protein
MPVVLQIATGSLLLLACTLIHIWFIVWLIRQFQVRRPLQGRTSARPLFLAVCAMVLVLLFSHTVQVYIWAATLSAIDALPGYEAPIYFALVTYTTLGYGDVVLTDGHRILGAMASVNGILTFGLSTAFLVGFFARQFREKEH